MTEYAKPVLRLSVYRNGTDCSNYGMSRYHDSVDLYEHDVLDSDIDPRIVDKAVKIVYRDIFGSIFHVEPVESQEIGNVGWMAGGTYVGTTDSRLKQYLAKAAGKPRVDFYGALSFHDRQETQSQYNALSR